MRPILCVLLALLGSAGPAAAQVVRELSVLRLPPRAGADEGDSVVASVAAVAASARPGGFGHVRIELENRSDLDRLVEIELAEPYGGRITARALTKLPAQGRRREFLLFPGVPGSLGLRLRCDAGPSVRAMSFEPVIGGGVSLLIVPGPATDQTGWKAMLERRLHAVSPSGGPTPSLAIARALLPGNLPPDWRALAGFDLVVLDGRAELPEAAQQVLRDHLRAGGRLLVHGADLLPNGPLRDMLAQGGITFGFGSVLVADAAAPLPGGILEQDLARRLDEWLTAADGALRAAERPLAGPLPPSAFDALHVPGLGEVPMRAFFVLILGFVVIVGPLNYLHWRRRRRLPMLLLTVPAIGFLTTLVMLAYGILSEGLGVRGALRSITLLDQVRHEAVAWSGRTLYAGIGPGRLTPWPGTAVSLVEDRSWSWRSPQQARFELLPDGTLDGSLLPSRTRTTLGVVSLAPRRERLRFERQPDGTIALLASDGLAPFGGRGELALRDFDGGCWIARDDGRLERSDSEALRTTVARLVGSVVRHQGGAQHPQVGAGWSGDVLDTRLLQRLDDGLLPPGHYLARLAARSPAVDELGLDGELARSEILLGRLAAEDIVD